nr:hypothetical protein [Tanacetum cinerariifolium]
VVGENAAAAPAQPLSVATLGRAAAARGRGPRRGKRPAAAAGRRAHRQPRLGQRPRCAGPADRIERGGHHRAHGHALRARRPVRPARRPPARRAGGAGKQPQPVLNGLVVYQACRTEW